MTAPAISIVLPTHNRAHLLPRALRSVLAQTDPDFELVVVDDGSTDDTPAVLAGFAQDPRIRSSRNDVARGAPAARNLAVRNARGKWVAFVDDDDELLPDYIADVRKLIAAEPGLGLIWTGIERYRHDRTPLHAEVLLWNDAWDGKQPSQHPFLKRFALSFGVAIRRDMLLAVGLFDECFTSCEDIDLAMRLVAAATPYKSLPAPLLRVHIGEGTSLSRNRGANSELRLRLLEKNAAFLASQPAILAHYRLFAMSGCYSDGEMKSAHRLAMALLGSGRLGWRGLEMLVRHELRNPWRRLRRSKAAAAVEGQ